MNDIPLPQQPHDPVLDCIEVTVGDITKLTVDAIVNAANESLLGGGGVDGAIHRAAGKRLLEHTRTLGGCQTGLAVITPSFDLETQGIKNIIHTVGPVWRQKTNPLPGEAHPDERLGYTLEDTLLASCYMQCFQLAAKHELDSLAFPAISTGVYHFPKDRAAKIAFGHAYGFLAQQQREHPDTFKPQKIIFCCFSEDDADIYRNLIADKEQWLK